MRSPPPFATLAPLRKPPAVADVENAVLEDHVIMEDVTCAICLSILHEPTSLQCGHTFCCSCVRAALRRTSACPVCRQPAHQRLQVNRLLARLLMQIFPNETLARRAEVAQDAARQPRARTTGSFGNVLRLAPILLRRVGLFASLVLLAALCALAAADSGGPLSWSHPFGALLSAPLYSQPEPQPAGYLGRFGEPLGVVESPLGDTPPTAGTTRQYVLASSDDVDLADAPGGSGGGSYPAGGGSYPAEESGLFSSLSVSLSALAAARRRGPAADVPASPSLDAPSVSYLDDEEEPLREGPGRDGPGRDGALGALPSSRPVHVVTAAAYPAFPAGPGRSGPFLVGGGVAAVEDVEMALGRAQAEVERLRIRKEQLVRKAEALGAMRSVRSRHGEVTLT